MADRIGQQLGNYRLTRVLGQGGFAEVYLAEHIYLKTRAAIKVLMTQLASDEMESFLNEARTIANLVHPNIVRVLEFGIDGKTPYLVMDYAPNGTIRQRYPKKTRLEPAVVASYVKQIAAALQYAHDQKLIHRDIKPENLLIGRHNEILLSDFGIALVAQSSRYQNTQDVVGTVAYMSPEQIQGKPRPSSDQYSLAVVVYEWLCGERPFQGSFTELCTQHMFASPTSLRERVPTIPLAIEQVVNVALAKDPKQRFATVQAFANALEQASGEATDTQKASSQPIPSSSAPYPVVTVPPSAELAPMQLANMAASPLTTPQANIPLPPPPYSYTPRAQKQGIAWNTSRSSGIHPLLALILSTILFGLCYYGVSSWATINPLLTKPLIPSIPGAFSLYFTPTDILFGLIITIPLFFAVEGGPWAGLVSVVVGNLLSDYIISHQFNNTIWYYYVANALQVCIPGFALIGSRYLADTQKIARVLLWTTIGIVVSSLFAIIGDAIAFHYSPVDWFAGFFGFMLSNFACLIVLPVLIVVYDAITRKSNA